MYLTPLQLEAVKKGTYAERPASSTEGILYYTTDSQELYLYTSQGWILPATPPAVVTSVTPTNSGSGRAFNNGRTSISFTQPASAGVSTNYTAVATPISAGATITATGSSSPVIVTGLSSNTSYTYTITGSNSYGQTITTSSPSVLSTTVPQTPTSIVASGGNSLASVSITPGETGGSAITSYTVTPYIAGVAQTGLIVSNSSSPVSVTGLTNATAYTFTATVTNANGTSTASSASSSVTPGTTYAIGATGPGGGIVFYDAGSTLSWGRYLEADIAGGSSGKWVYNLAYTFIGTTQTGIGTGRQNTANIYPTTTSGTGAYYTWNYSAGGFNSINNAATGWFLPSIDELYQMNLQKVILGIDGVGYTWSSSEHSQYLAWQQNFGGAGQNASNKNLGFGFYPVRAF